VNVRIDMGVAIASGLGFVLGSATVAGLYAFYPPTRNQAWPIPTLALGSIVLIGALYMAAARLEIVRAGDWLVLGYTAALVLAASLVVTEQLVEMIRARVPENDGIRSVTAACVRCVG
jgi:hypothetical protein